MARGGIVENLPKVVLPVPSCPCLVDLYARINRPSRPVLPLGEPFVSLASALVSAGYHCRADDWD
jgi:hypothetical protein